jgi:hypothetical protein
MINFAANVATGFMFLFAGFVTLACLISQNFYVTINNIKRPADVPTRLICAIFFGFWTYVWWDVFTTVWFN